MAIYLLRKYTGISNRQIVELLGNISYSAVAKAYQRYLQKLRKDKLSKKRLGEIMSNVKGPFPFDEFYLTDSLMQ